MKIFHRLAALGLFATSAAFASSPVTVTVKNLNTTATAVYSTVGPNEESTYVNSTPKPMSVPENGSYVFNVLSPTNPNVNFAVVRYSIGPKLCVFSTTYSNTISSGGTVTYTKTATPSGGATCTATITSINFQTYAWAVTFTIQ
jgi:hypothetical protein